MIANPKSEAPNPKETVAQTSSSAVSQTCSLRSCIAYDGRVVANSQCIRQVPECNSATSPERIRDTQTECLRYAFAAKQGQWQREQQRGSPNRGVLSFAGKLAIIPPLPVGEGRDEGNFGQSHRSGRAVLPSAPKARNRGYLLTEALVYIGAVFLLIGIGFAAMYRCIDNSLVLRRNADDIARAMHIGELWRADVRSCTKTPQLQKIDQEQILQLDGTNGHIEYRFTEGALYRRTGTGPWGRLLEKVRNSAMHTEASSDVIAWHWDLELQPQTRGAASAGRMRPLFTFIAVPRTAEKP
jgi:hypothetical protein